MTFTRPATQLAQWGTADVIASSGSASDTAVITFKQVPATLLLPDSLLLHVGESVLLSVVARDSGGSGIRTNGGVYPNAPAGVIEARLRSDGFIVNATGVGRTVLAVEANYGEIIAYLPIRVIAAAATGSSSGTELPASTRGAPSMDRASRAEAGESTRARAGPRIAAPHQ